MAYDEYLAERISKVLSSKGSSFEEKKMFGGMCYMVDDKMCVGVVENKLMARIDPNDFESFLSDQGARPMDFTNRPMKGFIYVEPDGIDMDSDLEKWVERCLEFNPKAQKSKKRSKKNSE